MVYFADSLKEVCHRLDEAGIPYMISGSTAANLYSQPRATNDVDIVIQINANRATKLLDLFRDGFYISEAAVHDAFDKIGMLNIIHLSSVTKFDLILLGMDAFSKTAFSRRVKEAFEGSELWFISLEDLILQKLLWHKESNSELQLQDVRRLMAANRKQLDEQYCATWARSLGIEHLLKPLL